MTITHLLEDFSKSAAETGPLQLFSEDALEDLRLTSFEQGYSAGWDDAVEARSTDDAQASRTLVQSLEDLSFTFHEARAQILANLEPLFTCITEGVVPDLASEGLTRHIASKLTTAAADMLDDSATVFVAPGRSEQFAALMQQPLPIAIKLSEDPCLAKDQVILRLGASETVFDADALSQSVKDIIDTFLFDIQENTKHG